MILLERKGELYRETSVTTQDWVSISSTLKNIYILKGAHNQDKYIH